MVVGSQNNQKKKIKREDRGMKANDGKKIRKAKQSFWLQKIKSYTIVFTLGWM